MVVQMYFNISCYKYNAKLMSEYELYEGVSKSFRTES